MADAARPRRSSFRRSTRAPAVAAVVDGPARRRAPWKEILVVDDGSTDETGDQARGGRRARDSSSRTTRATAPRSRPASATPSGEWILILDGDGQHHPGDARAAGRAASASTTSWSARARAQTQATAARRLGQRSAQRAGRLSRRAADPGSDLRVPRRAPRAICSSSSTCCRTASRRRRRRRWRFCAPATTCASSRSRRGSATGQSKIRLARDGARFFLILLKVITIFSPLQDLRADQRGAFALGVVYGVVDGRSAVAHSERRRAAADVCGDGVSRRSGLRTDLHAALSEAPRRGPSHDRARPDPDVQRTREPAAARRAGVLAHAGHARAGDRRRLAGRHRRRSPTSSRASIRAGSTVMHRTGRARPGPLVSATASAPRSRATPMSSARWTPTCRTIRSFCRR